MKRRQSRGGRKKRIIGQTILDIIANVRALARANGRRSRVGEIAFIMDCVWLETKIERNRVHSV